MASPANSWSIATLRETIRRHWGFTEFRALQQEAMSAVLDGRDSLVVMPTGGGKSLCFQAPALLHGSTTVVISPLIALMKDQVDGLRESGVNAVQLNSSQDPHERDDAMQALESGTATGVPVSRAGDGRFRNICSDSRFAFAIDEAHQPAGTRFRPNIDR